MYSWNIVRAEKNESLIASGNKVTLIPINYEIWDFSG